MTDVHEESNQVNNEDLEIKHHLKALEDQNRIDFHVITIDDEG
jgi:hypothetical protein